jgi:hypothetical protein
MKEITLTQGKVALVDDEDFEYLSRFNWHVKRTNRKWKVLYAVAHEPNTKRNSTKLRMHRLLLPDAKEIDHINGDGLDNRRCNLRPATHRQNLAKSRRPLGASGLIGVDQLYGKWRARITVNGIGHHLGMFTSKEEAVSAYNAAAQKFNGEFARTNL